MTAYCGQCSQPVHPADRYCGACGARIAASAVQPISSVFAPSLPPVKQSRVWIVAAAGVLLLMTLAGVAGYLISERSRAPECSARNCLHAELAPPLPAPTIYTSRAYGWSLQYSKVSSGGGLKIEVASEDDRAIRFVARLSRPAQQGLAFPFTISSEPGAGRGAEQIVDAIQRSSYPDATLLYRIPQAELGYAPGSGAVYSIRYAPGGGQAQEFRAIIMVAIKNGIAVEAIGLGAYLPDFETGHPNPAKTLVQFAMTGITNTVRWRGDPPL